MNSRAVICLIMLAVFVPILKVQYYDPSTITYQSLMLKMTALGFGVGVALTGLVGWITSDD